MSDNLHKTALITGASGGLGMEFARLFAKDGHDLVLVARSREKMTSLAQELQSTHRVKVSVLALDLSQAGAAQEVFDYVMRQGLSVDFLINNAGFGDFGPFINSNWEKQQEMLELNITTLTHLCRLLVPQMVEKGSGRVLNVASLASFLPGPLMSVYYASKSYVLHFSEALSKELQGSGVTVTALCPGPTITGFADRAELGKSGLFQNLVTADAQSVCAYGYRRMLQGKAIAIPGMLNRLTVFGLRLVPRSLARQMAYQIQKERT